MFTQYCTWENFEGRKVWRIWQISDDSPKFYPQNIQLDKSVLCDYWYPFTKMAELLKCFHQSS